MVTEQSQRNVAILGGSFNPPHICHTFMTQYVLATTDVTQIWFLPCYQHAFGKALAPFEHRLAMCRLAVLSFQEKKIQVLPLERERKGTSWTIDTVRYLKHIFPDVNFRWIIGSDVLSELNKWKDFDQLVDLISFVIVPRSGSEVPDISQSVAHSTTSLSNMQRTLYHLYVQCQELEQQGIQLPNVSSSQIRERLKQRRSIDLLVPHAVKKYIEKHSLYKQD